MTQYKNRDKSKKRATILNGAIDVFTSMGYELASMDKIAETAGVSAVLQLLLNLNSP